jgi:hypothetical protein
MGAFMRETKSRLRDVSFRKQPRVVTRPAHPGRASVPTLILIG